MRVLRLLMLLPCATTVIACDDDDRIVEPQPFATVRFFNAAAVDTLGVWRNGINAPFAFNRFRTASDCIAIPTATQALQFRQIRGTTELAAAQPDFEQGQRYTIVVSGSGQPRTTTVLRDEFTPPDMASILVRFINASSTPGDVHATPPGGALGTPIVSALPVLGPSSEPAFVTVPIANTQIRFFDVGVTTGTPRATINLTGLPASRVTSVVFLDAGTPPGATAVRSDVCP